ncbi:hypothetical protein Zmor_018619 [Zophobas morio]|uniref:Uncharacterized protein n=1 Tax=Zophobas morio TaxID=2755281 RepID=A0AA38ME77_9CUCU|nr:hypothetical protein Zmor_018619 [Zophobas morio]
MHVTRISLIITLAITLCGAFVINNRQILQEKCKLTFRSENRVFLYWHIQDKTDPKGISRHQSKIESFGHYKTVAYNVIPSNNTLHIIINGETEKIFHNVNIDSATLILKTPANETIEISSKEDKACKIVCRPKCIHSEENKENAFGGSPNSNSGNSPVSIGVYLAIFVAAYPLIIY